MVDYENVQRNKIKEKGEMSGRQVGSKQVSKSFHAHNQLPVVGRSYLYVKNQELAIDRPW